MSGKVFPVTCHVEALLVCRTCVGDGNCCPEQSAVVTKSNLGSWTCEPKFRHQKKRGHVSMSMLLVLDLY